ncbi:MAG TPA: HAD family hydrolase [Pseudomonadota bacterium]|nr:HAD family hydrolase [Pseudomonadota bacterium]
MLNPTSHSPAPAAGVSPELGSPTTGPIALGSATAGRGAGASWPPAAEELPGPLRERLARIRLLCLDVDGVLSDGHLYFLGEDEAGPRWGMRFAVRDGVGIKRLQAAGIEVAILSEGALPGSQARARSLGVRHAFFGLKDKLSRFTALCQELGVAAEQAAFVGDELSDLPLLRAVGFAATVPEAVSDLHRAVHYITQRPGGAGAVREVCEMILGQRSARAGS